MTESSEQLIINAIERRMAQGMEEEAAILATAEALIISEERVVEIWEQREQS